MVRVRSRVQSSLTAPPYPIDIKETPCIHELDAILSARVGARTGSETMAAKRRHWKEKDGRFWARIAIPVALRPYFDGKTQLTEALGGDLRTADKTHPAAVARLQAQIAEAECYLGQATVPATSLQPLRPMTSEDEGQAVWLHYSDMLANDTLKRAAMPTPVEISSEYEKVMQRIEAGEADPDRSISGMFNISTDYELLAGARHFDQVNRRRRLAALQAAVDAGDTRLLDEAVQRYITERCLEVEGGSKEWLCLAQKLTRAEIDALRHTLERDHGVFDDTPSDQIIKQPAPSIEASAPVPLIALFHAYILTRQAIGKHRDGGANWESAILALIKFLGHDDAGRLTKRNLLDWRDSLMASGKKAKTVSDKHLAAVSAILKWAFVNDRLPSNAAETVRQEVPRKVQTREKGYTTIEAVNVLTESLNHRPIETTNPSNRESSHITAAKRWVPLLCAFTGARVSEITQLRKEDIRQEGDRWILRITPDAGSVKTGQYRDVPLHRQVVALGFCDFAAATNDGPLFHNAKSPEKFLAGARGTAGRVSEWLNERHLVPTSVQPSYGWRHRFKTQGRELGVSDRVLDAIQGHPGKTASDSYGDVTISAKLKVIDSFPDYDLPSFVDELASHGA